MAARPMRTAFALLVVVSMVPAAPASARSGASRTMAQAAEICLPPGSPKCVHVKVKLPEELGPLREAPDCVSVPGVRERCEGWASRFDMADSSDRPWDIAVSPTGDAAYVTGESWEAEGRPDFVLESYDTASGSVRWTVRHDYGDNGDDKSYAVAVHPGGQTVYVVGREGPANLSGDAAMLAVDAATGDVVWEGSQNGPRPDSADAFVDVVVSPDGERVFGTGYSYGGRNDSLDYLTAARDAVSGDLLWSARNAGADGGVDQPLSTDLSADGTVLAVTGYEENQDGSSDAVTVGYDTKTGGLLWRHRYDGAGGLDWGTRITAAPVGGTFYVAYRSHAPTTFVDYVVEALDAVTGVPRWTRRIAGEGGTTAETAEDTPLGIAATADRVIVTGYSYGSIASDADVVALEYLTVGLDAVTGGQRWAKVYEGLGAGPDVARDVALSADGSTVYVTGGTQTVPDNGFNSILPGAGYDFATLAYSVGDGNLLWTTRHDGGLEDYAMAAAPLPQGGVVVTGASLHPTDDYDYLTVRYAR